MAYAQPPVLLFEGRELSQNETITISDISPITGYMQFIVSIKNPTNSDMSVKVRRFELAIVEESMNYFCFGNCFEPSVSESGVEVIPAGVTKHDFFYADYEPAPQKGTSEIRYEFSNVSDVKNPISVTVRFSDGVSGLEDIFSAGYVRFYSSDRNVVISYDLLEEQELLISDITGKQVGKQMLTAGRATQKLSFNLNQGIYIYSVRSVKGILFSGKFIVH
jgi:hypothetical protein